MHTTSIRIIIMANLCQSCFSEYNGSNKKPRLLECNHIFCERCISGGNFVCSYCEVLSSTPVAVLPIVTELIPVGHMCPEHHEHRLKFYCLNDNVGLCSRCRGNHNTCDLFMMTLKTERQFREELRPQKPSTPARKRKTWKCSDCNRSNPVELEACDHCGSARRIKRPSLSLTPGFEWTCDCGRHNFTGRCTGCRKYYQNPS